MKLEDIAYIDRDTFKREYSGSAITRASYEGFSRNAVVALYNIWDISAVKDVS